VVKTAAPSSQSIAGRTTSSRAHNQIRILQVSSSGSETAYLRKAFQESALSVPAANQLRDALYLASHEEFDAIGVSAMGITQWTVLFDTLSKEGERMASHQVGPSVHA
jgi:hypothetical protein